MASTTEVRKGEVGAIKTIRDCRIDQLLPPGSYGKTGATSHVDPRLQGLMSPGRWRVVLLPSPPTHTTMGNAV